MCNPCKEEKLREAKTLKIESSPRCLLCFFGCSAFVLMIIFAIVVVGFKGFTKAADFGGVEGALKPEPISDIDKDFLCEVYQRANGTICEDIVCPEYYTLSMQTGNCIQKECEEDFYLDSNGESCILNCTTGMKPNHLNDGCSPMCSIHEYWNTTYDECFTKQCDDGEVLNFNTGSCEVDPCQPGQRMIDGECESICRKYFFYDDRTSDCIRKSCPAYHFPSEAGTSCIKKECPLRNEVPSIDGFECISCPEGRKAGKDKTCVRDHQWLLKSVE